MFKKLVKKITAVALSCTMVMAMGVTAFAANNEAADADTVTVRVQIENPKAEGQYLFNEDVTLDKDASLYKLPGDENATIENNGKATAMDAIIDAADSINYYRVQYMEEQEDGTWEYIDRYGIAFDELNGTKQKTETVGDKTVYSYWQLRVDNKEANDYATHYVLKDGMTITVDWSTYEY